MGRRAKTPVELVEYLLVNAIPNGECLECHLKGSIDRQGRERPYIQVGGVAGKKWGAPRLVLHIKKGPLTENEWALHSCDNPKCINLDHLFAGTAQDNTDDMIAKGRKVDDSDVGRRRREWTWSRIKPLYEQGINNYEIAFRLKISINTVRNRIKGAISIPSGDEDNVGLGFD